MDMVIGNCDIARRFIDYTVQSTYRIFAGSVNNSTIWDKTLAQDEESALRAAVLENNRTSGTFLVYFSSCSVLDPDASQSPYVRHKIGMEEYIQGSAKRFWIFRVPQVLGLSGDNSGFMNHIIDVISNNKHFELSQTDQYNVIDVDDVYSIVGEVLRRGICLNEVVNLSNPNQISAMQLVCAIEKFTGRQADYTLLKKGTAYTIDISAIRPILKGLRIDFGENYIAGSLNKYYAHISRPLKRISIIVPTYNEELGINEFYRRTKRVLIALSPRFDHEIIFVNDCSTDNTLERLRLLAQADENVLLISFSRNFGNQIAITAGMEICRGDLAIVIDDDLQDPPEIIVNLIAEWDHGFKVVYGVRTRRQGVNHWFQLAAKMYYRIIGILSDVAIPIDTGDFRLIDRVVIDVLKSMKEEGRYYRGMVAWVGFPQIGVAYERDKRFAGVSTFSFKKYIDFALNGLTSFTDKPLYFSSLVGLFITIIAFVLALILIVRKISDPSVSIRGWTSLAVIVLFFGGIQLLSTGILGVYISKIYREVKGRPLYVVESTENIRQHNDEV